MEVSLLLLGDISKIPDASLVMNIRELNGANHMLLLLVNIMEV